MVALVLTHNVCYDSTSAQVLPIGCEGEMAMARAKKWAGATWLLRALLPASWQAPLKVYAAQHGVTVTDITAEAYREWAERRKLELPPA